MDEYQMEFATGFGESYLNCPACGKEMVSGHSECFSCGVVVNRFQDRLNLANAKQSIGGIDHLSPHDIKKLDKKWKQVVVNYHDQNGHQDFLKHCQSNGALPFAIHHYSKMLEIDKEDDIADLMRRQALSRLTIDMTKVKTQMESIGYNRLDVVIKWACGFGIFMSTSFVVAGVWMPAARNLVGLGVASLALFIALMIFRRN